LQVHLGLLDAIQADALSQVFLDLYQFLVDIVFDTVGDGAVVVIMIRASVLGIMGHPSQQYA
jgi:hypothetical protein